MLEENLHFYESFLLIVNTLQGFEVGNLNL